MTEHRIDDHTIEMRDEPVRRIGYSQVYDPGFPPTPAGYSVACSNDYVFTNNPKPDDTGYYARTFGKRKHK